MALYLPDRSTVALSTTYGTAKPVTGTSNANPAVATAAAHGLTAGAIIESISGWSELNNRIVRVANPLTGTFEFEDIDTTSTQFFPAGGGVGTVREITAWTQISEIISLEASGGDQQFATVGLMENNYETQVPTIMSARTLKITLTDDPTLPGYIALAAAAAVKATRAVRINFPEGGGIYCNGIVAFNRMPTMTLRQVRGVVATISLQSEVTRY